MRKKLLAAFILLRSVLFAQAIEVCESSEHFEIACESNDCLIAHELIEMAESFYPQLRIDFNHTFIKKLKINIFPNLTAFHEAIEWIEAPQWVVAKANDKEVDIVSPLNPGSFHSEQTIKKIFMLNIVKAFIYQKFGVTGRPFWVVFGVASNKIDYNSSNKLPEILPSLQQLEESNCKEFGEIGGFQCAQSFISFIEKKYGWEKILQFLTNYNAFEQVTGISKEYIYDEWVRSHNGLEKV